MYDNNLECVAVHFDGEFLWCVFEHATEQVIKSFYFEDEAYDYIRFLRRGGGFAGFTPSFMTKSVKVVIEDEEILDEEFMQEFGIFPLTN